MILQATTCTFHHPKAHFFYLSTFGQFCVSKQIKNYEILADSISTQPHKIHLFQLITAMTS